jgi:hypothetical protein
MNGHGVRRGGGGERKRGGRDRYLPGLEEDGGEEKGLEERHWIGLKRDHLTRPQWPWQAGRPRLSLRL